VVLLVLRGEKNIVVKETTWLRIGRFKRFPERSTFDAVINWLADEQQKREDAREIIK